MMSLTWCRRLAQVLGLAFAVTFLPQAAWAAEPDPAVLPLAVQLDPGQFAAVVLALGLLVALGAARLVLGMRR